MEPMHQPEPIHRRSRLRKAIAGVVAAAALSTAGIAFSESSVTADGPTCSGNRPGILYAHWPRGWGSAYFRIYDYGVGHTHTIVCYKGSPMYDWLYW